MKTRSVGSRQQAARRCFRGCATVATRASLCVALANAGVLFAPGYCFDAPEHFRLGFGAQAEGFAQALNIVSDTLRAPRLSAVAGARR